MLFVREVLLSRVGLCFWHLLSQVVVRANAGHVLLAATVAYLARSSLSNACWADSVDCHVIFLILSGDKELDFEHFHNIFWSRDSVLNRAE